MMDVRLLPAPLRGAVTPPPSKSLLHRQLICLAQAGEFPCPPDPSDDVEATVRGLWALYHEKAPVIDCGASGSTSRLRSVPGTPCGSSAAPPGTSTHQTAASPAQASAAMPAARRRRFCSDIFPVPSPFGGALFRCFGHTALRPAMPDAHCIMFRPVCARKRSGIAKIRRNIDSNN